MDYKQFFHKLNKNIINWWKKGGFLRATRISYDVVWNVILFFIIIGVVGLFFAGGVGAGYFASLVKDETVRAEEDMEADIYNYSETSEIYFADNVYMGEVSADLYREEITLDQVSETLQNAVIATEDEYFWTHEGIVPKAIMRALFQEVTNSSVKSGGSTLTQQIIKNQILTNEVSFERKAKEMLLALRVERFLDKNEILEAYLNIVPYGRNANGRNIAGIQTAAKGIFNVDAKDLNIAQAAYIAGIPQSPFSYTPFTNGGQVKSEEGLQPGLSRMKTVLRRMLDSEHINEEEYNEALQYDIVANLAEPSPTSFSQYPWLTNDIKKRATEILVKQLAVEDGYTENDLVDNENLKDQYEILASRALSQNGYKIHTTINKEIYDAHQKLAVEYSNYGRDKTARNEKTLEIIMTENEETGEEEPLVQPVQVGSILIHNKTGKIISFVGGRDFDIAEINHATDVRRAIGSTVKPTLVYAPAMELGVVQPGSIIADTDTEFYVPGSNDYWNPGNYSNRNYGLVSVRKSLYSSYNVPAAKTYVEILDTDPVENYFSKMGFSNIQDNQHEIPSMSLGVFEATVEENTNSYATFGNGGKFTDAYMIEKIETIDGDTAYQHESESVEVFSPQTNYLTLDIMRGILTQGTATSARANLRNPGVDWAGKTGTGNDYTDTWFIATNPNVTMGSWMGYDYRQKLDRGYSGRNQVFWAQLVNVATEIDPDLMAPSNRFERPGGIVSRSYCQVSGKIPSEICSDLGLVGSDLFNAKFVPEDEDNSLIRGRNVLLDGEAIIAGENTPEEFIQEDGVSFNPVWLEENGYDELDDIAELFPNNNEPWSNIAIPSLDEINNDGKVPNTPTSISKSGNALTWNTSTSKDVVGYRIYRANDPDSSFNLIGNTIETDFNIGNSKAVYYVTAVDYFGEESEPSSTLEVGDFSEPEKKPEEDSSEESDEDSNDGSNDDSDDSSGDSSDEEPNDEPNQNDEETVENDNSDSDGNSTPNDEPSENEN
ncbi:hypothetical protein GCM10011351_10120 [Paraliobacillus quinghaiensis]|uniref:Penicillin-sensitive transpeptidase n=1 Tax=Paraliobacillus quinghaiensis TaxID=470815 RepID=A0A917TKE1_9BACI|nr:transglycosylase domain-containing protein [Paraliobacillus quinghaiensis]GGM26410.1 hypothetical protein GCM10011351_10120 [Paraliobacillus quinghaiensis]